MFTMALMRGQKTWSLAVRAVPGPCGTPWPARTATMPPVCVSSVLGRWKSLDIPIFLPQKSTGYLWSLNVSGSTKPCFHLFSSQYLGKAQLPPDFSGQPRIPRGPRIHEVLETLGRVSTLGMEGVGESQGHPGPRRQSPRMNRHIGSGRKHKARWRPKVISTANNWFSCHITLKSTCVVWRSKHWHSSCQLVNLSTSDRSEAETTSHRLCFHVLINQTRETSRFDKKWVV